ncbi:hypothetical protein Ade02nite_77240 [Paractinoplanes deccanensis]|uniref:Trypsin-co-occurring domain-containing protein n=1 Tax=Paractinoplanes deccanensis TaxID=113561 RepID=A0ABQ3YGE3_9ACTN|nr:CU044_2847 family protein [Actinoplanes deccanensis]GID79083.1 hypothetical protein Ade02nite_77240 [Actinoplanes deccanensis]
MATLARIPLEGGGAILVEAPDGDGPVKAGRLGDLVRDLPGTLQTALEPVTSTARVVIEQLRRAKPTQVEVEFGVDLSSEAGAVITKSEIASHLVVKLMWQDGDGGG